MSEALGEAFNVPFDMEKEEIFLTLSELSRKKHVVLEKYDADDTAPVDGFIGKDYFMNPEFRSDPGYWIGLASSGGEVWEEVMMPDWSLYISAMNLFEESSFRYLKITTGTFDLASRAKEALNGVDGIDNFSIRPCRKIAYWKKRDCFDLVFPCMVNLDDFDEMNEFFDNIYSKISFLTGEWDSWVKKRVYIVRCFGV